jgi:ATP-binding cassette subfamily B protein
VGLALGLYLVRLIWMNLLFGSAILVEKLLRTRLMAHLTRMTPSFYHRHRTGDLMALATNDIPAINQTAGYGVLTLFTTIVGVLIVLITMATQISVKLMLAALVPMPFLAIAVNVLGKQMRKRFLSSQQAFGHMNDHVLESISGLRVLRSYVQEQKDLTAFDRVTGDVLHQNRRVALIGSLFQPIIQTIVGLSFAIGIGYGAYLVFHNELTVGQLASFNIYLGFLIWPMISFGEFINVLQRGSASADRLQSALDAQPDVHAPERPVILSEPGALEMRDLTFAYPGTDRPALRHIQVKLDYGQTLGVVGRTGSGKSTLLKQLLRQYAVEPNRIFLAGVAIEQLDGDQLKRWIGYVPQEHLLLSKMIRENIALGHSEASSEEIQEAVRLAYFDQDVQQMKDGLETMIGEHGVMLSGGQKQRVAIARALLIQPEILILDDALSAVDARTEHAILHNIKEARKQRTTLISSHRLSAVAHAHHIIVLEDGAIVEEGSHEELMTLNGWYRTQYDRQQLEASLQDE